MQDSWSRLAFATPLLLLMPLFAEFVQHRLPKVNHVQSVQLAVRHVKVQAHAWLWNSCAVKAFVRPISSEICVKVLPDASLAASSWLTRSYLPVHNCKLLRRSLSSRDRCKWHPAHCPSCVDHTLSSYISRCSLY